MLQNIEYTIDGHDYAYTDGGIACPGETLIFAVKGAIEVTSSYGR